MTRWEINEKRSRMEEAGSQDLHRNWRCENLMQSCFYCEKMCSLKGCFKGCFGLWKVKVFFLVGRISLSWKIVLPWSMWIGFTYIYHRFKANGGNYTNPMDPAWVIHLSSWTSPHWQAGFILDPVSRWICWWPIWIQSKKSHRKDDLEWKDWKGQWSRRCMYIYFIYIYINIFLKDKETSLVDEVDWIYEIYFSLACA